MAVACDFMYDEFSDRLLISRNLNEKIVGSIRIFNLTIDFTTKNKIANIEIKNVSEYLKSIEINPKILNHLTSTKLMLKQCREGYLIYFILESNSNTERIPCNIQSSNIPELVI